MGNEVKQQNLLELDCKFLNNLLLFFLLCRVEEDVKLRVRHVSLSPPPDWCRGLRRGVVTEARSRRSPPPPPS